MTVNKNICNCQQPKWHHFHHQNKARPYFICLLEQCPLLLSGPISSLLLRPEPCISYSIELSYCLWPAIILSSLKENKSKQNGRISYQHCCPVLLGFKLKMSSLSVYWCPRWAAAFPNILDLCGHGVCSFENRIGIQTCSFPPQHLYLQIS